MKQKARPSPPRKVAPASQKERAKLTPRREKWFRIAAVTVVPALLLAMLEFVLRVAGYGYPTGFFRKTQIAGRTVYVENADFGLRFFPKALARLPSPTVVPATKGSNTFRIFILGESAALGDPEPAFGFGRYLEVMLQEKFPGVKFEVVCASMTAINSHALLPIARDCAKRDGDLWVIYMGNNEVVGPFGAGTVIGPKTPPLFFIRTSLALKTTRTGQLLDALIDRLAFANSSQVSWEGMKMFLDAKTRHDEPNRRQTDDYFGKNLEAILKTAKEAGVPVLLCTVATNLKDCAPFASMHSASFTESQRGEWERFFKLGAELERATKWQEAITNYQQAAAIDGDFAELQFRLGRCYSALDQTDAAERHFKLARDLDALPFRASSTQNEIIKQTAGEFANQNVFLLDVEGALGQASPGKIIGAETFYEHVHLNFQGNQQLARLVAEKTATLLPQRFSGAPRDWPSPDSCDQRLAVTPWDRYRVYQNVAQREKQPPFTLQLDHVEQTYRLSRELLAIRAQMDSNQLAQARSVYQQALTERPDDFILRGNYAKLLEETGDFPGAVDEWKRVCELLPYHFGPDFYLGKLLARLGRFEEAEHRLTRTLEIRPDTADALDELGGAYVRQKRPAQALVQFKKALALQPGNARLHLHIAEALAAQDRRDEALTSLRRAIQLRPDYWEARYFLGVELAMRGELSDAGKQFSEVIRLKPDHALAHLNLGVALAKQNRVPEAILEFRQTLRLDPSNQMASEYLSKLRAN